MAEFAQILSQWRQQMSADLKRSDVLRALIWPNAGLLMLLTSLSVAKAETWILIFAVVMLTFFLVLYAAAYIFFALTDSDALRSETYKLQKMAIEHRLIGDNKTGLIEVAETDKTTTGRKRKTLPLPTPTPTPGALK